MSAYFYKIFVKFKEKKNSSLECALNLVYRFPKFKKGEYTFTVSFLKQID